MSEKSKLREINKFQPTKWLIIWSSFLLMICMGCYENIEGCLDVNAVNFDVTADIECEDCCQKPQWRLNVLHNFTPLGKDTFLNFSLNNDLTLDSINFFEVDAIRFYLSDFKLIRTDGTLAGVDNEVEILTIDRNDSIFTVIEDNFLLIDRSSLGTQTIGSTFTDGDFVGIQFNIGVTESANQSDPANYSSSHPLTLGDSTLYFNSDSGYVFNQLSLFRDTTASDTIPVVVEYGLAENLRLIQLNTFFSIPSGFNTTFTLRINYRDWLEAVDFRNDTESQIMTKIKTGLTQSFELVEVEFSN